MQDVLKNNTILTLGTAGAVGLFVGVMLASATINSKIAKSAKPATTNAQSSGSQLDLREVEFRLDRLADEIAKNGEKLTILQHNFENRNVRRSVGLMGSNDEVLAALAHRIETLEAALETKSNSKTNLSSESQDLVSNNENYSEGNSALAASSKGTVLAENQAAAFADGAVRVYMRRFSTQGSLAYLTINGTPFVTSARKPVEVPYSGGSCIVGVASVTVSGANIIADC
ncbi:MAG: hypothetical protein AAGF53_15805 [Pseudomonadota bacterium]